VTAPHGDAPPPCVLCERTNGRIRRRGLCRSCYRKLRDAGCTLPPRRPTRVPGPAGVPGLVAYVRLWPAEVRARLLAVLEEAKAA
jgi:hypothetical protein